MALALARPKREDNKKDENRYDFGGRRAQRPAHAGDLLRRRPDYLRGQRPVRLHYGRKKRLRWVYL